MSDSVPDEKKVYALTGVVGANISRLRQDIDRLRQIHDRWKDSNGTSINLIAQLTSLKSNLGTMQDWLNYASHEMHPQLLSDLDVVMTSCGLLERHLNALVERLQQPDYDPENFATRLKYSVGSRAMERLRKVAQRQNEAVALLLAACNCHATAQRKILLHKTRQIKKENDKSLRMLARSSTLNGGCIMTLTRISRIIQWFRFLFYMKILHKESEQQPTEKDIHIEAAAIRSEAIDRTLQEDATTLRHETKLVLIGNINSGKELIVHQMKTFYAEGHYSNKDREGYRYAVRSTVRVLMHSIIDLLKDTGITLPPELNQQFAILLHEVETSDPQRITAEAVRAVEKIWFCPEFSTLYIRNFEIDFPQYAPYFTQQLPRIARSDYVPNEADIVRLNLPHSGIKELRFNWDELDVHLFNIHGFIPDHFRKRWFHQLEDATSLMFTVDVSQYDRPYLGQATESQLLADFATFESWASSEKFANSSIILVLNNFTRFLEKLPYSPLEKFFSDFVPNESDPESSARQYILRRFKNMNRNHLSIYSFWVDLDMSDNQPLYAALKKTLQHDQQRRAKSEVGSASTLMTSSGSRSGNALASKHSRSRSGTLSGNTLGTGGSRVISPVQSDKIA